MKVIYSCLYMKEDGQYFVVEELGTLKGTCLQMIAPEEIKWRSFETLEEPPFQKVAKYMRNIEYRPQNVRTFPLLSRTFDYLADKIGPLLLEKDINSKERYSIAIFLQERLKAIRCELFVQGIISPVLVLRLIRANILIEIMKEEDKVGNELVGLEHLIDQNHKAIMSKQYPQEYQQALSIALLSCSRNQLQGLLSKHEIIFEDKRLTALLRLRLKLQANNFQAYYDALLKQEPLVQCLLWRRIQATRESFIQVLKKSFGDVPLSWLYKRLGFDAPQLDGWICLKQMKETLSGVSRGIRLWISQQGLQQLLS